MIPLGVDPARYREILYEPTQAIGDAAYFLGFDSIIAPEPSLVVRQPDPVYRSDRGCRPGSHRVVRSQLERVAEEAEVMSPRSALL
jgi:hypothetical protein